MRLRLREGVVTGSSMRADDGVVGGDAKKREIAFHRPLTSQARRGARTAARYPARRLAPSARASMSSDSSSPVLATSAHGGGSSGGTAVSRLVGGATSGALELICFHPGAFLRGRARGC